MLIELKQWSKAEQQAGELVRIAAYGDEPVLHPAEQVRRYCQYLVDSTPALAAHPHFVRGLAYLHNASTAGVASLKQYAPEEYGQLYTLERAVRIP